MAYKIFGASCLGSVEQELAIYEIRSGGGIRGVERATTVLTLFSDTFGKGRISSANIDQVSRQIPPEGTVLAMTPSTSMSLFRADRSWKLIMDVRDAAAMDTTDCDAAVSIDWDATVMNLLSGKEELSYCLIPM